MNEDKLREVLTPVVEDAALELEAVEVMPVGKRHLVRITLDGEGPKGRGPSLDEITSATRAISAHLDESTVTGDRPYTLEVSSRGTSRPLTEPKHWRRNLDRLVKVVFDSDESVEGRITEADEDGATLTIAGAKKQPDTQRQVVWADVRSAVIQVELNRKDAPREDAEAAEHDLETDEDGTE